MGLPAGPSLSPRRQALGWIVRPEALMERAYRECGDVFTLVLPLGPVVAFCEPAALKAVFTGDPALFRAGDANAELEPAVGPESVLLLDGPRHLRRRRLVLPPFHGDRLARYAELMAEITADEVRTWPRGRAFALEPRMRAITLDVILRVVFGIDDARRLAALRPLFGRILPRGVAVIGMLPFARRELGPWSPWARFQANIARIDALLFAEIARRRADPGLEQRDDVLSMLLLARDDSDEPLTDRELRDELMTLLLAGHETTTVALAWTFELLFRNRDAHERAVAVARSGGAGGDPAWLDAVVAESLRLKPPLPMVVRRLAGEAEIAGHRLPAGTRVAPCIYLTHRRADIYPRPAAFRPERFLGGPPDTYAWLPFGGGIRRCVGASFAQLEMRTVLQTVLAATDLRPASTRPERTRRRTIVLAPQHGARAVAVSGAEPSRDGEPPPAATPSARAARRTPVAHGRDGR